MLHIDGHDTPAVERAARIARGRGIPVSVDVDTIYPGFDRVLPACRLSGREFGISCALDRRNRSLPRARNPSSDEYRMKVAAMTLGAQGALARAGRPIDLFARLCRQLRGHDRRRRRVPRGVLLCCAPGDVHARGARIFQRHGRAELHAPRSARRNRLRSTRSAS